MSAVLKSEADRYDRLLNAAADLAELIEKSGIHMDELILEELTLFLAENAVTVKTILKNLKFTWV